MFSLELPMREAAPLHTSGCNSPGLSFWSLRIHTEKPSLGLPGRQPHDILRGTVWAFAVPVRSPYTPQAPSPRQFPPYTQFSHQIMTNTLSKVGTNLVSPSPLMSLQMWGNCLFIYISKCK